MVCSAGSVVKPSNFDFGLKKIKEGVPFVVGYGCTEVMGFTLVSETTLPVYRGEISSPTLGVAFQVLDDAGKPVVGEMGELLLTAPIPSLPLGFWKDDDGQLFRKSYFSKFPGMFCIGDTVVINPFTKGIIVCGRSDETLKPKGCRYGSSEIYNIVEEFPEIATSLIVSQYSQARDERAVLFLKMREGHRLSGDLLKRVQETIASELSAPHVPGVIVEAPDVPRNANGKKMEIVVKKIINDMPHNVETVANPACLDFYRSYRQRYPFLT